MKVTFSDQAWEDYLYWQATDQKVLARIHELIKNVRRSPFSGIGKPEPLKHAQGYWSRRINSEHRMVYKVVEGALFLAQIRYHY